MCPRWPGALSWLPAPGNQNSHQGDPPGAAPQAAPKSRGYFGHQIRPKGENILRVVVQNINSISEEPKSKDDEDLLAFVRTHQIDIMCLSELNKCWKYVDPSIRIPERFRGFWEALHHSLAYNQHSKTQVAHQHGGVAILSLDQAAYRNPQRGCDPSGLGRWAWTQFRG